MSDIALYNLLKRIPGATDEEAKEAVGGVASAATKSDIKDMATKSDIKNMATKSDIKNMATKSDIRELKTELKYQQWFLGFMFVLQVAIFLRLFMS